MIKYGWNYLKKYKHTLYAYIFLIIIENIINIITPLLTGEIINVIIQFKNFKTLLQLCVIYFFIQVFIKIINFFSYYKYIFLQTFCSFDLNKNMIKHVQNLSIDLVQKYDSEYLNQRINADSNTVISFVIKTLTQLPINICMTLTIIVMLLCINIEIGIFFILICGIYSGLYLGFRNKIFRISYRYKERQNLFFSVLLNQIKQIKLIKIHSLFAIYEQKLENAFNEFWDDTKKAQIFFYLYSSLYSCLVTIAQIFVYIWGGLQVINGKISVGTLTIIIGYFQTMLNTITYVNDFTKEYQDSKVSYHRLLEIQNLKEQTNGLYSPSKLDKITCNDLTIRRGDKVIIKNFSYEFEKGEIYCLIGKNGSGKTTFAETIIGLFIDQFEGEIKYNGICINEIDIVKFRFEKVSFLEQFPELISDTFLENIYITTEHKPEILKQALKKCNFPKQNLLKSCNKDCKITGLSGGETQKMALMRVMSKNADIYIFDEGSSSLDTNGKEFFSKCIELAKDSSIVFVISHDENFINANKHIIKFD